MIRWLSPAALAFGLVVLIAVPTIVAAAPRLTVVAPFHRVAIEVVRGSSSGGCANASRPTVSWSHTTGAISIVGNASSRSCKTSLAGVGAGSSAESFAVLYLAIPVNSSATGKVTILVNATFGVASTVRSRTGVCTLANTTSTRGCSVHAEALFLGDASFVDLTNQTTFYATNDLYVENNLYNQTSCSGAGCYYTNFTGSTGHFGNYTWYDNATLVSGHRYAVVLQWVLELSAILSVERATLSGADAVSSMSIGGSGHPTRLTSIWIS